MNIKSLFITIALASSLFVYAPQALAITPATQKQIQTPIAAEDVVEATDTIAHDPEVAETEEKQGVAGMFGLNWKLFLAQLINFAIILFVLWKWVFGPVTKGLTTRTEKIEASLVDAQKIAADRETFDSWKKGEIATVRQEASAIIAQAKVDAEAVKTNVIAETKAEQEKIATTAKAQLEQEKNNMLVEVKSHIAELVVNATETILRAKLDPKKDAELIKTALQQAEKERA